METRPDAQPWDGVPSPTNSPEDRAVRHVNAIMYNIPEVRSAMSTDKQGQPIQAFATPIHDHIEELSGIRTQLKNMDAQISVKKLKKAHEKFLKEPSEGNLNAVAREALHLGHQLNITQCHIASHIEEMKAATHILSSAVKRNDQQTILHQKHMLYILMGNLLAHKETQFHKDIQQLHQNFLIFRTIEDPNSEDVSEWQKALNEFPPMT